MKVIVHTFYTTDPSWGAVGEYSSSLFKKWCDKHGYDFKIHNKRMWPQTPSIAWEKIPILLRSFKHNDHDWHIFIDADIFITNFDKRVEDFLGDRAVYMGSDWNFPLNMGFVAMQAKALPLLQALKRLRMSNPYGLFEQGATQVIREVSKYWEKQVVALDHNVCNSYAPNRTEKWKGSWKNGDFVVHFAGWPVSTVLDFLKPALDGSAELTEILVTARKEILAQEKMEVKHTNF